MYKNIVFDVDGTLINSTGCTKEVYRQLIIDELGITYSYEEVTKGIAGPTVQVLRGFGFKNIPDALSKYHTRLMQAFQSVDLFDGMAGTLDILKKRCNALGIVTARNQSEIDDDVVFKRIRSYFDCIISADDTTKFKPDPDPLLLCLNKLNARPNETVYIGDAYTDFLCAKNTGVDFGLALWGAESRNNIDAEYFLSKPEDILDLLD